MSAPAGLRGLLLAALLAPALLACSEGHAAMERFRPLAVGEPAPAYAARPLDGGDSLRVAPGQPVTLVNVWATWCIPCQKEFPELQRLHDTYGARGLRVLAVSIDRGDAEVRAFVDEQGSTFPIGRDADGMIRDRFQTIGVPESFLVGADGTLLWRRVGELPEHDAGLAAAVEAALR